MIINHYNLTAVLVLSGLYAVNALSLVWSKSNYNAQVIKKIHTKITRVLWKYGIAIRLHLFLKLLLQCYLLAQLTSHHDSNLLTSVAFLAMMRTLTIK